MEKLFAITGGISALLGVVAGAFGGHGLKDRISPEMLEIFETAVRYQMYHAFGLFFVAWAVSRWPDAVPSAAGWSFIAGTVLFSGSLYVLSLAGIRWLGAVTPLGGVAFIVGWILLVYGIYRA
ncbi:MAG: DUF423 domain-containing protein [Gemmatimonadota bacterium]|nr:DUF423 domain-containing protein [Gemmatimonadota bacterium]